MVLYCLVGIEVIKRRRALRLVSTDMTPLDAVISHDDITLNHIKDTATLTGGPSAGPLPGRHFNLQHGDDPVSISSLWLLLRRC
jgi:hypothetical protein